MRSEEILIYAKTFSLYKLYMYKGDMDMIKQTVKADSLSCIISGDYRLERLPEPFRMQKQLSLHVFYAEYVKYVQMLNSDSPVHLRTDIDKLKSLATTNNGKLYECFLKDLAFAICKEIWYAELYKRDATTIVPTSYRSEESQLSDMAQCYNICRSVEYELNWTLVDSGYTALQIKNNYNRILYQFAVVLYYKALYPFNLSELNVINDYIL